MTDAATASSRTMKGRNMVVVFFSRAGENYEVGEVTVGNTAKLAQEVARRTDSPMIEIFGGMISIQIAAGGPADRFADD